MLLLRGATVKISSSGAGRGFNTCSSCEEQPNLSLASSRKGSFNTCSSCEEQPERRKFIKTHRKFQYMLLLRGATGLLTEETIVTAFQYMLLLRGATG